MKITKQQLRRIIKESIMLEQGFVDKTARNRGYKYSDAEARKLKNDDPMGYLMAKYGEGASLRSRQMKKEGVYDIYEDWIQDALDDDDPNVVMISRDLAIHLPEWNK